MYIISVSGPIAAGKSTFLEAFEPRFKYEMGELSPKIWFMQEPQFFKGSKSHELAAEYFGITAETPKDKAQDIVYRFQLAMLYDRAAHIGEAKTKDCAIFVMERSPLEDEFFWDNLHGRGLLSERDLAILHNTREHLFGEDFAVDVLININIPAKDAYQNALNRAKRNNDRAPELNVFPMETYELMHEWYFGFTLRAILAGSEFVELKFANLQEDLPSEVDRVCEKIKAHFNNHSPGLLDFVAPAWENLVDLLDLDDSELFEPQ